MGTWAVSLKQWCSNSSCQSQSSSYSSRRKAGSFPLYLVPISLAFATSFVTTLWYLSLISDIFYIGNKTSSELVAPSPVFFLPLEPKHNKVGARNDDGQLVSSPLELPGNSTVIRHGKNIHIHTNKSSSTSVDYQDHSTSAPRSIVLPYAASGKYTGSLTLTSYLCIWTNGDNVLIESIKFFSTYNTCIILSLEK